MEVGVSFATDLDFQHGASHHSVIARTADIREPRPGGQLLGAIIDDAWRRTRRRRGVIAVLLVLTLAAATTFALTRSGGSGDGAGPGISASGPSGVVGASGLTACPSVGPEKAGTAQVAAGYNGRVDGISCSAAGSYIVNSFIGGFQEWLARQSGSVQHLIRFGRPDTFRSAGFDCRHHSLADDSGWALACQRGAQELAFTFTP